MGVANERIPLVELVRDRRPICLQAIGNDCVRSDIGSLLRLFQGLSSIGNKLRLRDLAGEEIPRFRVHDIPYPFKVALLALLLDETGHLVGVPDVGNLGLMLVRVLSHQREILLDPPYRGRVIHFDVIELAQVVTYLTVAHTFEEQVHRQRDGFRVVLHAGESLIDCEPMLARFTCEPLNLAELRSPYATPDDVPAPAGRAVPRQYSDFLRDCLLLIGRYALLEPEREPDGEDVLAVSVVLGVIETGASPGGFSMCADFVLAYACLRFDTIESLLHHDDAVSSGKYRQSLQFPR